MFGNFIYFILVLLIYLTYQPGETTHFSGSVSAFWALALALAFVHLTRHSFKQLEKAARREDRAGLDNRFHATLLRQSILAVVLFAIDIYALNLPSFLVDVPPFRWSPTLEAVLFLGVFVIYLAIIWYFAHGPYRWLYRSTISRKSYVLSNITFSLPVLLPWVLLSGIADLIFALPFAWPKNVLASTGGQIAYFLFFLIAIAVLGPVMIQKFWRCTPLEAGDHRRRIERLCRRAAMGYSEILYWPIFGGKMLTAGVMGLVNRFRYILVTPALLQLLDPPEIDAVIAHEIGHVKKKHLLFYLFFFVGFILLASFTFDLLLFLSSYSETMFRLLNSGDFASSAYQPIVSSAVFVVIFLLYFRFVFGYFMRNFERQADCYVYTLFDDSRARISTLYKIAATSGQSPDRPNWHHFSIGQRMAYLEKCEADPRWISRHNRKVRNSILAFFSALLILAALGYQFSFGTMGANTRSEYLKRQIEYLERQAERFPGNPFLYASIGTKYYELENYADAARAWEKSLNLESENPYVLNNLAWLYARCESALVCFPQRALELAEAAVRLDDSHYILDTLAESYHANGMHAEAIETEIKALQKAGGSSERKMYQRQIERFRKALEAEASGR